MVATTALFGLLATLAASVSAAPTAGKALDLSFARRELPGGGVSYDHHAVARSFPAPRGLQARQGCTHGDWACNGNTLTICQDGNPVTMQECGAGETCSTGSFVGCAPGGAGPVAPDTAPPAGSSAVVPPVNPPTGSSAVVPPVNPPTGSSAVVPPVNLPTGSSAVVPPVNPPAGTGPVTAPIGTDAAVPPVVPTQTGPADSAVTSTGVFNPETDECLDDQEDGVSPVPTQDAVTNPIGTDAAVPPPVPTQAGPADSAVTSTGVFNPETDECLDDQEDAGVPVPISA